MELVGYKINEFILCKSVNVTNSKCYVMIFGFLDEKKKMKYGKGENRFVI